MSDWQPIGECPVGVRVMVGYYDINDDGNLFWKREVMTPFIWAPVIMRPPQKMLTSNAPTHFQLLPADPPEG
jgi:hypothetical protein